jgi:hypothetical protein
MLYTSVAIATTMAEFNGLKRSRTRRTLSKDSQIMSDDTHRTPTALELPPQDQLIDGVLEKAVKAAQRNVEQFAKLAALARAIEQCNSSPATRAKLLFTFEELASNAEADAKLDEEFFEGLRNGQVLKQELRREHEERTEPIPEITIFAPSTTTKH